VRPPAQPGPRGRGDGPIVSVRGPQLASSPQRPGMSDASAPARSRIDVPADARDIGGDFAHRHPIDVRLADTDAMGHVNNANYLTYVEIARIAYYERVIRKPLPLGVHGAEEGM